MYKLHVKDSLWSGLENLPQLGLAALLLAPDSCSKAWVSEPRKVGVWCLHEASRARSPWGSVRAFLDPCLILPGPTTGDDWINLLTGNLDKSWRFARICHRLPPNSCWLHAHSIIFFCWLNPDWIPMALLRERGVVRPLRCLRSSRSWNVPVLSAAWKKMGKIIGIHRWRWWRWSFNRLSSRQTFWISLIHFDSFIFYHMLSMVFPLALRSIFVIFFVYVSHLLWPIFPKRLLGIRLWGTASKAPCRCSWRKRPHRWGGLMARGFRAKWGYPQRPQKNHPN